MTQVLIFSIALCADTEATLPSLDGTWTIVATEMDGKRVDAFVGRQIEIAKDKLLFHYSNSRTTERRLRINTQARPIHFDELPQVNDGTWGLGIAKFEKGMLVVCKADTGGTRPDAFGTKSGDDRLMFWLQRHETDAPK